MKSFISLILLSLLLAAVLAKKSSHKGSDDKGKKGWDVLQNEGQNEKDWYYRKRHFDHLSAYDLHKMTKLSPIHVSEDDIRLQADIDQKPHKTHERPQTDLHLQDLNTRHRSGENTNQEFSNTDPHKKSKVGEILEKTEEKQTKHKHSFHKKHELFRNDRHRPQMHKTEQIDDNFPQLKHDLNARNSQKSKPNKEQKHVKNHNKKHEKKFKKDFEKKYKKYNKYY